MSEVFHDADRCAEAMVDRVGRNLRLAVPISIGCHFGQTSVTLALPPGEGELE